jgi:hypothetical protein
LKVKRCFGGRYRFHLQDRRISQARNQSESNCLLPTFTLVTCLAYYSPLKMEASCSSGTSFDFQQTRRCCIPEGRTFYENQLGDFRIVTCGQTDQQTNTTEIRNMFLQFCVEGGLGVPSKICRFRFLCRM